MTRNSYRHALRSLFMVALLSASTATMSSAATLLMGPSPEIPAAEGRVKTKLTSNKNTQLELKVKHLAPPARISPGTAVFVVWVRGLALGAEATNLGALRLNKNLSGKLRAITPMTAFDVFLTCEPIQTVTMPGGRELMLTHYTGE